MIDLEGEVIFHGPALCFSLVVEFQGIQSIDESVWSWVCEFDTEIAQFE